jgi:uncharacterized RDD family membrane protein YckC
LVLAAVLSDVLRCVLYYIVCPFWVWQWYCLTFFGVFCITLFLLVKNVRQYHGQNQQGQTMLYKTHRRTSDNTMAKTNKDKQCYTKHIEESQTILAMVLSDVLRCILYNIVSPCWFWPWYCLTFFDVLCIMTNNVIRYTSKNVRQYHGQNQQGQTM